jgi:hypothetical protein
LIAVISGVNQLDESGFTIDWSAPWLGDLGNLGHDIVTSPDWRGALNRHAAAIGLINHNHQPVRFVAQDVLPAGSAYEAFIHATGNVPTRDNLHDLFNALVWLTWPATKAQLNHLQATQIASQAIVATNGVRGATRDAVTLFDESAAILAVSDNSDGDALIDALRQHRWTALFVTERERFTSRATPMLFGHAIMEKLVNPYKAITAHTLICRVQPAFHTLNVHQQRAQLDAQVAGQVGQTGLQASQFTPLPVLGVPGWWPQQDIQFYSDTSVFRPPRK